MGVTLAHAFSSAVADGPDLTKVNKTRWNAHHPFAVGTAGEGVVGIPPRLVDLGQVRTVRDRRGERVGQRDAHYWITSSRSMCPSTMLKRLRVQARLPERRAISASDGSPALRNTANLSASQHFRSISAQARSSSFNPGVARTMRPIR